MCGIGGFFGVTTREAPAIAQAMAQALSSRGPDATQIVQFSPGERGLSPSAYPDASAPHALIHTRLSIIDPRPEANQPMASADGQVWICYNGEVYGWEESARPLAERLPFNTHADTEFILRAYLEWGMEGLLPRLRGMFALAILDLRLGKLFLVRDRWGKKPLLWWSSGNALAFGSTVRALLPAIPGEQRRLSADALDAYLAHRYVPAPLSAVDGVHRLANGHWLEWELAGKTPPVVRQWWQPEAAETDIPQTSSQLAAALDESILLRCTADRPVGIFLSGGVDSSVIATRLAALGKPFHAFTAGFADAAFDEVPFARKLAQTLGLSHHVVSVPQSIRDDFAAIVAAMDEPFADPSAIPLWYLAREATQSVKVVLGGDGGDELLGGYKRYAQHMRSAFRAGWRLPGDTTGAYLEPGRWQKILEELSLSWRDAYALRFSGMRPGLRRYLQPGRAIPPHYWRQPQGLSDERLPALLALDHANYLPEYILRKGDLATMAHGLELRSPLLDQVLAAKILGMPPSLRFTAPPKRILGELLPGGLQSELWGQKKRGFNPPLRHWLQRDLAERQDGLGQRLEALSHGQLQGQRIEELLQLYRAGASKFAENVLQLLVLDESLQQLKSLGLQ